MSNNSIRKKKNQNLNQIIIELLFDHKTPTISLWNIIHDMHHTHNSRRRRRRYQGEVMEDPQ
jgi:hypothetical protein